LFLFQVKNNLCYKLFSFTRQFYQVLFLQKKPYWWIHFWLHFININQNIVLRTISIITVFSRLGLSASPDFKYILRSHKILLYATLGDSWEIPEKQLNAFFSSTHRCIKAQIFQTDQSLVWKASEDIFEIWTRWKT
jgi:hypothetical protein